jgi:hypothetical protein
LIWINSILDNFRQWRRGAGDQLKPVCPMSTASPHTPD